MMKDYGSRDKYFMDCVKDVRSRMLGVAGLTTEAERSRWTVVPMQGSGTMGIESCIATLTPRSTDARYLVIRNGSYSERQASLCVHLGIATDTFDSPENEPLQVSQVEAYLKEHGHKYTNVGMVHGETGSGLLNPVVEVAALVRKYCRPETILFLDSMSVLGGIEFNVDAAGFDCVVTSSNKCVQGVPGFSLSVVKRAVLRRCGESFKSRSFTLNLWTQFQALEASGQFPQTPPTSSLVAFRQALLELEQEGGVPVRAARYRKNCQRVVAEMSQIGFQLYLNPKHPSFGYFIVAFLTPKQHPKWNFETFYSELSKRGSVIYPGKATKADTFRVGCIGDLHASDFDRLFVSIREVLTNMGVLPSPKGKMKASLSKL